MKTLYLDIFSGISGDMFVGAMLDLGVDLHHIERELAKLSLTGYHLHSGRHKRNEIEGVKFDVHLGNTHHEDHGHAHHHHDSEKPHTHGSTYADIRKLIESSALSDWVKSKSLAIFHRIAVAEGKIHGLPPGNVHFHEVGAIDSIVDIVAACVALESLGKPRLLAAPVVEGRGWIDCAHGRFPIPAPATLQILAARAIPITQTDEPNELITPTGAALLAEFVEEFAPMSSFAAEKIGIGIGSRENKTRPNILRVLLGTAAADSAHDWQTDTIAVLETNLDDASPELLGHFLETALAAGALDIFHAPIQMKKNRPGVLLTLLCDAPRADEFTHLILVNTTAFGVRRSLTARRKLRREFRAIQTPHGEVTVKLGLLDGKIVQVAPEFESCKMLAAAKNLPVSEIFRAAVAAWKPAP